MTPADVKARLADLPAVVAAAVGDGLNQVAAATAADARRRLGAASPSQPGASPADPAGRLADATASDGAAVRVDSPFAADLEYGTRRMAARPFLRPAVAATAEGARRSLTEAVAKAIAATFGAGT